MASSPFQFMFMRFLVLLLSLFFLLFAGSFAFVQSLCHDDESSALLKFKESFIIDQSASYDPSAYPKVSSWKVESGDCCLWDGVECDENTGHVISLDLSSSCLSGSINSNSSLFQLVNLRSLNLADNDFSHSPIPTGIRQLPRLTYLNLSYSVFSGQIPSEILQFTKLVSLDLSFNLLYGEFPTRIFQLPNLQSLDVRLNTDLTGYLPEFNKSSHLISLRIAGTNFSGKLPDSIGNLKSLHDFDVNNCSFSGPIPSSLANLTELIFLDLSFNTFSRGTLSWLGKQTKLTKLFLRKNQLTGRIPSCLANFTQLTELSLADNELHGPIPLSISRLVNLNALELFSNHLSGILEFDLFLKLKKLFYLELSNNNLSLLTSTSSNATLPKFKVLALGFCDLGKFPDFLRNQDKLKILELNNNKIHGLVPKWIWKLSKETLLALDLSCNFLTGFDQPPHVLPWTRLQYLNLDSNNLQGSLPIPPPSILSYLVSNNTLTGEISPMLCNLSSLFALDLSNNKMSGLLPDCLGNLSASLSILDLSYNNFHGTIPQICMEGSKLGIIDFSQNQLQGRIPRSLANCTILEILALGNNQINDTFPSWLGILPKLRVLILRSNGFHGAIGNPESNFVFPELHIIDLSNNNITGTLLGGYFQNWKAMQVVDHDHLRYIQANASSGSAEFSWSGHYDYLMKLTNKGVERTYERTQDFLIAIDLSRNRFEGDIPEVVGNLKGLHMLNLSNNLLSGPIPSSLMNLTQIESLDLSQNKLSGEIPPELTQLYFLEYFNVSHNCLTGAIPHGNQFNTFQTNSFDGNTGLCGSQLSKKCGNSKHSPPSPSTFGENQNSESPFEFGWKVVVIGYGCGFVVGIVIGQIVITRNYDWFMKNFARRVNI